MAGVVGLRGYLPRHGDPSDLSLHPDHLPTPKKKHQPRKAHRHKLPHAPEMQPANFRPWKAASKKSINDHAMRPFTKHALHEVFELDRTTFLNRLDHLQQNGHKSNKTIEDFDVYQTLGEGSFGRVVLAQDPNAHEDDYCAIKILDKQELVDSNEVQHTFNEKNLLFSIKNRFIVEMYDYFHDSVNLMYVLEFVNGGEFMHFVKQQPEGRLDADVCQFYMAELVLGLEYLHNLDIIFRDLKPENLLLTCTAHLKVTDFGFAKRLPDSAMTYTFCGTPDYIAPEIVKHRGYGVAVDWWAFGVVVYECLSGVTPFSASSELQIFSKILSGKYSFPKYFSVVQKLFIGGLLQPDLTRRMGYMHGGVDLIKLHPYFKGVQWTPLMNGELDAPVRLEVDGPGDATNFVEDPHDPFRDPLFFEGDPEAGDFNGAFDHF